MADAERLLTAPIRTHVYAHVDAHACTQVAHRRLVQSAVEANFNVLRVWGGGIWEPDAFFDACDELGLLLYTDMQAYA